MRKAINGFCPDEVFQLYDFLDGYETARVGSFQSQSQLFEDHPEMKDLLMVQDKVKCHEADSAQMKDLDLINMQNEIYFTIYHSGQLLSLLYHLRNSIAHACAIKHGSAVLVTDFKVNRPTDFSARGRIEMETINAFTLILKKIQL